MKTEKRLLKMKMETNILCYSGKQKANSKRVKEVEYTVVNIPNKTYVRDINKRLTK